MSEGNTPLCNQVDTTGINLATTPSLAALTNEQSKRPPTGSGVVKRARPNWDAIQIGEVAEGPGVRSNWDAIQAGEVAEEGDWLSHPLWALLRQAGYEEW